MVVMVMGRKRRRQAWKMARSGVTPSRRSTSMAKSIMRMAFFFTMPMSRMMPMKAMTLRSMRQTSKASRAPMPALKMVERMVSACRRLS